MYEGGPKSTLPNTENTQTLGFVFFISLDGLLLARYTFQNDGH